MKYAICATLLLSLSGCLTMSGEYTVTAQDASGAPLTRLGTFTAEGHNIYPIRNAFCLNAPGRRSSFAMPGPARNCAAKALITAVKPQRISMSVSDSRPGRGREWLRQYFQYPCLQHGLC